MMTVVTQKDCFDPMMNLAAQTDCVLTSFLMTVTAQFFVARERHQEAAEMYKVALSKSPNDFDIVFNAANAFRSVAGHLSRGLFCLVDCSRY